MTFKKKFCVSSRRETETRSLHSQMSEGLTARYSVCPESSLLAMIPFLSLNMILRAREKLVVNKSTLINKYCLGLGVHPFGDGKSAVRITKY